MKYNPEKDEIIGKTFGRLTVISFDKVIYYKAGKYKNKRYRFNCICPCTNKTKASVTRNELLNGNTKSCGCLQRERVSEQRSKHNMSFSKIYSVWDSMRQRCSNPNNRAYKWYGARGITYDPRWNDFLEFKKDMYISYLYAIKLLKMKKPSLERKDVNGNYCKENCCWIPLNEQGKNKREQEDKIWFEAISPEGKKCISDNQMKFAKEHNLTVENLNKCLNGKRNHHKNWKFKYLNKEK